ncbi:cytochrome c heme lyase subunit CcmF [Candidatus Pelagibacter sp. IMCC9063]|uniref:heme lyase CcmF/NrfE family subunit n=1 Tax=Pelagibacter sp. (strain IMCC9063) TaxID=1002672 RepID=UPI00020467E0|nr:heme lyase CcmF/NrfE family subunit [Candidatus Pelagibacter sp. IMCC9063]AEA80919.1 cytochrome c heme lyase subunit CcmF [Candidatus Pelagibacter sp. IMCC9063]
MISNLGAVLLIVSFLTTCSTLFLYIKNNIIQKSSIYFQFFLFYKVSFYLILFSFLVLIVCFTISDFSIISVYENSHTDKPLFYKISAAWGNHEGSMLLFILVISLYGVLFLLNSKNINDPLRACTIFFQSIIQLIFLSFLIFTSNPYNKIFPIPAQGLGLNPILQDPLLAIHPPFLYLGYVGFSLVFSLLLAALILKQYNSGWASIAKKWIMLPWSFLSFGIALGSFWAYYELGWGGYWFWDPVENASLMPWIASTALIHSIVVMEKLKKLFAWTAILTILTFLLSLFGTFLVRSGVLNSVHAFANDPERGVYILLIISAITLGSLIVYILKFPKESASNNSFVLFSRDFSILLNNYFLIFILTVVIVGTTYPILLSVFTGETISVGPQYYNTILAPFIFVFLILMAIGPLMKWNGNSLIPTKQKIFLFFLVSIFLTILISFYLSKSNFIFLLGVLCSVYLITSVFYEIIMYKKNSFIKQNFSRLFSHLGFGLLILAITLNHFFSKEITTKIDLGESFFKQGVKINFLKLESNKEKNFEELFGSYEIIKDNKTFILKPSIRKYKQPQQFTSETSIQSDGLSDVYIAMDYAGDPNAGIGVRFYYNYFVRLIWVSFALITIGGIMSFVRRGNEKTI